MINAATSTLPDIQGEDQGGLSPEVDIILADKGRVALMINPTTALGWRHYDAEPPTP